ncbi:MAG: sec-independent protein translocase protein TatC [Gaiellaceae bacterium]|nr:sec-independent protein translocase protein TatC [Gaiellaceae bacterium]
MRLPTRLQPGESAELVEHLGELRARLVIVLLALAGGFAVAYGFHHELISWLNQPLPPGRRHPVTFGVAEPFTTSIKVSLYAGFALALPVILWQLWGFLAPAVERHTQRTILGFVVFATGLFVIGVGFAYRIALPAAVHFLTNYDKGTYDIQIRASSYYSFALLSLIAVGLVYELPIFVLALVRLRVLSSAKLRRNRKAGYAAMAALAVALPGVDPVTTAFEMLPLMALFELSIWLSVVFERRWLLQAGLRAATEQ